MIKAEKTVKIRNVKNVIEENVKNIIKNIKKKRQNMTRNIIKNIKVK